MFGRESRTTKKAEQRTLSLGEFYFSYVRSGESRCRDDGLCGMHGRTVKCEWKIIRRRRRRRDSFLVIWANAPVPLYNLYGRQENVEGVTVVVVVVVLHFWEKEEEEEEEEYYGISNGIERKGGGGRKTRFALVVSCDWTQNPDIYRPVAITNWQQRSAFIDCVCVCVCKGIINRL